MTAPSTRGRVSGCGLVCVLSLFHALAAVCVLACAGDKSGVRRLNPNAVVWSAGQSAIGYPPVFPPYGYGTQLGDYEHPYSAPHGPGWGYGYEGAGYFTHAHAYPPQSVWIPSPPRGFGDGYPGGGDPRFRQ